MKKFLSSASLLAAVAALVLAPQFAHAAIVVPEAGTASLIGAAAVPLIGIAVMLRNRRK